MIENTRKFFIEENILKKNLNGNYFEINVITIIILPENILMS